MNINHLLEELKDITAREAADILCNEFGVGTRTFRYALTKRYSTPNQVLRTKGVGFILAKELSPIIFVGGPTRKSQYRGSLLTLLCDCILNAWVKQGAYSELVGVQNES